MNMEIQLLQDTQDPEPFFVNPIWCCSEKLDGDWRRVQKLNGEVIGTTREGNAVALSAEVVALALLSDHDFIIEGECMKGGSVVAFDITSLNGISLVDKCQSARFEILQSVWSGNVVARAIGESEKRALFDRVWASNGEGIVFARVDAPYTIGRSPYALRFKRYQQEVFEVSAVNIAKCSVEVSRHGKSYGGVPVQSLARLPKVGDKILVRYDRVTEKGKLLRAVLAK